MLTGSVPGGFTSALVEQTASDAGLQLLFTSEPTQRSKLVNGMHVVGRFSITRATSETEVDGLANGDWFALARQAALWNSKKLAKRLGGRYWLAARRRFFER